jgi:arginine decarboxylase
MSVLRVVWGGASGPTPMSAYDAALAEANIHNYNLVTVSSVIPAGPPLEVVGTAPDLGPAGNRLTVVQSKATRAPGEDGPAAAGIGWARSDSGRGIFYEATGEDPDAVRENIEAGLAAGKDLRDWDFLDEETLVREAAGEESAHTALVVCAVYGESTPLV